MKDLLHNNYDIPFKNPQVICWIKFVEFFSTIKQNSLHNYLRRP